MATARGRRAQRRNQGSELGARVIVALPAIAFAIFIVVQGGEIFALGVAVLGLVCLHELFAMYPQARPARLAGFVGLLGVLAAARYGDRDTCCWPSWRRSRSCSPSRWRSGARAAAGMALTVLGVAWIGLAFAHAVLLRELPHGGGIVVDVLVGTFVGDTGAYSAGACSGAAGCRRPSRPTRPARGWSSASSRASRPCGSPASTRTGCRARTR